MTRYEKSRADFLIATMQMDPQKRFRALNQMGKCVKDEFFDYLFFAERFESKDDITPEEARKYIYAPIKRMPSAEEELSAFGGV